MNPQQSKETQSRHRPRRHQVEPPLRAETRPAPPPLYRPASDLYGNQEVRQSSHRHTRQSSDQNTRHRANHPEPQTLPKPGVREAVIPHQTNDRQHGSRHSHRGDHVHDHGHAFYHCQLARSEDLISDMIFMTGRAEYCLHNHQGRTQHSSADCTKLTLEKLAQRYHAREAANNRHSVPWEDWMADIDFMSSRILYCIRHHRHKTREAGQECGLAIEDDLARRRNTRQEAEQSIHGAARAASGAISEPVRLYREALVQREKNKQEELQAAETNGRTASRAAQSAAVDALWQVYRENVHKLRREAQHRAEEHRRQSSISMPPTVELYLDEDFEKLGKEEAGLMQTLVRSIDAVYNARSNHAPPEQHKKAKQASQPLASAGDAPPTRLRLLEHVPNVHDVRPFAQVVGPRMADHPVPRVVQPGIQPSTYRLQRPTQSTPYPKTFPFAHLPLDTMTEEALPSRSSRVPGPSMNHHSPRTPVETTAPRPTESAKGPYVRPVPRPSVQSTPEPSVKTTPKPNVQPSPRRIVQITPKSSVQPTPRWIMQIVSESSIQPTPKLKVQTITKPSVQPTPKPSVRIIPKPNVQPKPHQGERGRREALKATGKQQDRNPRSQESRLEQHKREALDTELDMYREKLHGSTPVPSPTLINSTKAQETVQTEAPESSKAGQKSQFSYMFEPGFLDNDTVSYLPPFKQETPSSLAAPQEKNVTEDERYSGLAELYSTVIPIRADTPSPSPRLQMPVLRQGNNDGYRDFVPSTKSVSLGELEGKPSSPVTEDERVWSPLSFDLLTPTSSTMGDWEYLGEVDGEGFFSDEEEVSVGGLRVREV